MVYREVVQMSARSLMQVAGCRFRTSLVTSNASEIEGCDLAVEDDKFDRAQQQSKRCGDGSQWQPKSAILVVVCSVVEETTDEGIPLHVRRRAVIPFQYYNHGCRSPKVRDSAWVSDTCLFE